MQSDWNKLEKISKKRIRIIAKRLKLSFIKIDNGSGIEKSNRED